MYPSPLSTASGSTSSTASPLQPLTPLTEVTEKLEEVAVTTSSPSPSTISKAKAHRNRKSVDTTSSSSTTNPRSKPLYIREGGSIPAIRFLEKEFGAPAAHFPCGQASDSAHLDNERLRLLNLYKSRDILKKVFRELPGR